MAFSILSTELVLFIAVMGALAGAIVYFSSFTGQTQGALSDQQKRVSEQLRSAIDISTVYFSDGTPDTIYIYVKNTGEVTLDANTTDVFIDNQYIDLEDGARILNPHNTQTVRFWEPDQTIRFNATGQIDLSTDKIYEVKVVTATGASDTYTLST